MHNALRIFPTLKNVWEKEYVVVPTCKIQQRERERATELEKKQYKDRNTV